MSPFAYDDFGLNTSLDGWGALPGVLNTGAARPSRLIRKGKRIVGAEYNSGLNQPGAGFFSLNPNTPSVPARTAQWRRAGHTADTDPNALAMSDFTKPGAPTDKAIDAFYQTPSMDYRGWQSAQAKTAPLDANLSAPLHTANLDQLGIRENLSSDQGPTEARHMAIDTMEANPSSKRYGPPVAYVNAPQPHVQSGAFPGTAPAPAPAGTGKPTPAGYASWFDQMRNGGVKAMPSAYQGITPKTPAPTAPAALTGGFPGTEPPAQAAPVGPGAGSPNPTGAVSALRQSEAMNEVAAGNPGARVSTDMNGNPTYTGAPTIPISTAPVDPRITEALIKAGGGNTSGEEGTLGSKNLTVEQLTNISQNDPNPERRKQAEDILRKMSINKLGSPVGYDSVAKQYVYRSSRGDVYADGTPLPPGRVIVNPDNLFKLGVSSYIASNPNASLADIYKHLQSDSEEQRAAYMRSYMQYRMYPIYDTRTGRTTMLSGAALMKDRDEAFAPASQGAAALGKRRILDDIRGVIEATRRDIANMPDFTDGQRTQLYETTKTADPTGALSNLIYGDFGKSLDPAQQQYLVDVLQLKEVSMGIRSLFGAGRGEDVRRAISETLPSAGTFSKDYADKQLTSITGVLDRIEPGIPDVNPPGTTGPGGEYQPRNVSVTPGAPQKFDTSDPRVQRALRAGYTKAQIRQYLSRGK